MSWKASQFFRFSPSLSSHHNLCVCFYFRRVSAPFVSVSVHRHFMLRHIHEELMLLLLFFRLFPHFA